MFPCLVRDEVCNTPATIILFNSELDEHGEPVKVLSKKVKGNFQVSNKEKIIGNGRTLLKECNYLMQGNQLEEITEEYCGGYLIIKGKKYNIFEIIPNYDLYGNLNFWRIITE